MWKDEIKLLEKNELERNVVLLSKNSGCKNVLIIAPHNKEQFREGKSKLAEPETEFLAKELNIKNDCHVIYKKSSYYEDGNRDDICSIKNDIYKILNENRNIDLVVNLHQLRSDRETDIDFGTANCKNKKIIDIFKKSCEEQSLQCSENKYFAGDGENHISRFIKKVNKKIECLQVEINSGLLRKMVVIKNYEDDELDDYYEPRVNINDSERVFKMLSNAIKEYSKKDIYKPFVNKKGERE